ncbi:hypothetical protein RhiJN_07294 [Ceratobasidium sp. AG-Ba]|nr:hypothetical protein RhiJN_07294 [Ceratobasidium sp. AG-Ba]QRW08164.1 hypothetical protein RhiLY_07163 [Ceratobasidium sp. AG-Ba]
MDVESEEMVVSEGDSTGNGVGGAAGSAMIVGIVVNETKDTVGESGDSAEVLLTMEEITDGVAAESEPTEENVRLLCVVLEARSIVSPLVDHCYHVYVKRAKTYRLRPSCNTSRTSLPIAKSSVHTCT